MKIGILYLCTGKYTVFWPEFYQSFAEKFLPGCEKHFLVFTDAKTLEYAANPDVTLFYQEAYDWPYSTLKRFAIFLSQEETLKNYDYLFFFNANLLCKEIITPEEFLPRPERGENLLFVQHPGFFNKKPPYYTYERRAKSTAYVPYNCGRDYLAGGLNGGTAEAFLAMCHELDRRIEQDLANGIIALWHDESQLNRYAAERQDYRLLDPGYLYPEGWELPFEQKIVVRNKSRYIDVGAVKHQQERPQPWLVRKWGAFKENFLPRLWCLRDTLLHRSLDGKGRV